LGRAFKKCLIVYKENPNQLKLICIEEPFSWISLKRCTTNFCLKGL
jgi:hypothetical protein